MLAASGGLLALGFEKIRQTNDWRLLAIGNRVVVEQGGLTSSNVQLRAAIEQAKLTALKSTSEKTSEETARLVDGIAGLVDLVAAAEVEVRAAGVASLADGHITGDGRDAVRAGRATELGGTESAEGEGKSGNDGELHLD